MEIPVKRKSCFNSSFIAASRIAPRERAKVWYDSFIQAA